MSNNVRIEFLGLNGVVPNRNYSNAKADSYLIALPDLANGREDVNLHHEQDDELPGVVAPHVPAVLVASESVISESGKHAAMTFRSRSGVFAGRDYSLYVFDQENLALSQLEPGPLDASVDPVKPGDPSSEIPTTPGEEHGLQWIPRLSLANGKYDRAVGTFDRARFLNSDLTPRATGDLQIAGTVLVEHGRFYTEDVMRRNGKPIPFEFYPPRRSDVEWQQSHYTRLFWDTKFVGDRLELTFSSGVDGEQSVISMRPRHGRCDMWIVNLELDALLDVGGGVPVRTPADLDFGVFYLYSTNVPSKQQGMPVLHEQRNYMGGHSPRCGAGWFEA